MPPPPCSDAFIPGSCVIFKAPGEDRLNGSSFGSFVGGGMGGGWQDVMVQNPKNKPNQPTKIAHKVSSVGCGVPHLLSQHLGGPHLNQFLVCLAFTFANKGKYYVKCLVLQLGASYLGLSCSGFLRPPTASSSQAALAVVKSLPPCGSTVLSTSDSSEP